MDRLQRWVLIVAWATAGSFVTRLSADDEPAAQTNPSVQAGPVVGTGPVVSTPGGVGLGIANQPAAGPGKPAAGKGKPEGEKKSGDGKEKGEGKSEELPPVQRSAKPPKPPNPKELKVRPGKDGTVSFNFRGQPWPAVLEWLADISGMSLDWQELPGDYINLATQRSYTVKEARDLVNRHLLVRGYTLLIQGEVLSVVNIKKLNPALVPRIEPEELARRDAHEFVRVSFPLDWMLAESAAEELKPYLSPNGKMTPLRATNRLEVMDTVSNLRDVDRLVKAEQSSQGQERLVHEFVIRHAKATEVAEQLRGLIGGELKHPGEHGGKKPQDNPMDEARRMQMMAMGQMQMMQPQPGQPGGQPQPGPQKSGKDVNLVVNPRNNSILVAAPPDKMAIAVQAVKILDVARDEDEPMMTAVTRTQVYRLASLDPETLVKALDEIGHLSPTTQFQVDKKNHLVVVTGPLADQMVIRSLGAEAGRQRAEIQGDPLAATGGGLRRRDGRDHDGRREAQGAQPAAPITTDSIPSAASAKSPKKSPTVSGSKPTWSTTGCCCSPTRLNWRRSKTFWFNSGKFLRTAATAHARVIELPPGTETDEFLDQVRRKWSSWQPNPAHPPTCGKAHGKARRNPPPNRPCGRIRMVSVVPTERFRPGKRRPLHPLRQVTHRVHGQLTARAGDTGGKAASGAVVSALEIRVRLPIDEDEQSARARRGRLATCAEETLAGKPACTPAPSSRGAAGPARGSRFCRRAVARQAPSPRQVRLRRSRSPAGRTASCCSARRIRTHWTDWKS